MIIMIVINDQSGGVGVNSKENVCSFENIQVSTLSYQ